MSIFCGVIIYVPLHTFFCIRFIASWVNDGKIHIRSQFQQNVSPPGVSTVSALPHNVNGNLVARSEHVRTIECNGNTIQCVNEFKYLGLVIDKELKFEEHCSHVQKKIVFKCGQIVKYKRYIDPQLMTIVFKSLVYSHIDYGLPVWGAVSNALLQKCRKTIDHALKCLFCDGYSYNFKCNNFMMMNVRQHSTVDIYELYEKLCLLTVFERHTYMTVLLTRSLLSLTDKLECISEIMRPQTSERTMRLNFLNLPVGSGFYQNSYQFRAAKIWNKLPPLIHKLGTGSFKYKLNEWIITQRNNSSVSS